MSNTEKMESEFTPEQAAMVQMGHVGGMSISAPRRQVIPEAAVEAAEAVLLGYTGGCTCHEGYTGRNLIDPECSYHDVPPEVARLILEAAAPHMLAGLRELVEDMERQPRTELATVPGIAAIIRATLGDLL